MSYQFDQIRTQSFLAQFLIVYQKSSTLVNIFYEPRLTIILNLNEE